MSKSGRDRRPYIRPVTKIELSETNIQMRWIAIAVLLAVAVVAIGYGFSLALRTEPGWQTIQVSSDTTNVSREFTLMYDFSAGDINPTAASKKLETLYSDLTEKAYRLFRSEAEGEDNLYALNAHINEPVAVDPALYEALEKIVEEDNRHVFLSPVRDLYDPVFLCSEDAEAAVYDPTKDPERMDLVRETAAYCADPQMISLQLLGNNQACLTVSEAYLTYARENRIDTFLDLGWMTNAFIVDYMADTLAEQGFVYGYLSSFDGFTRNLDIRGETYSQNIFHCQDNNVYMPAVLDYTGPMSIVTLRNYPLSDQDRWNYYAYSDGSITTGFLDPVDGCPKSGIDGVTAYSSEIGCADILLKTAPVFISDTFDAYALESLENEQIHSIYCQENSLIYTQEDVALSLQDNAYKSCFHSVK